MDVRVREVLLTCSAGPVPCHPPATELVRRSSHNADSNTDDGWKVVCADHAARYTDRRKLVKVEIESYPLPADVVPLVYSP